MSRNKREGWYMGRFAMTRIYAVQYWNASPKHSRTTSRKMALAHRGALVW